MDTWRKGHRAVHLTNGEAYLGPFSGPSDDLEQVLICSTAERYPVSEKEGSHDAESKPGSISALRRKFQIFFDNILQ